MGLSIYICLIVLGVFEMICAILSTVFSLRLYNCCTQGCGVGNCCNGCCEECKQQQQGIKRKDGFKCNIS